MRFEKSHTPWNKGKKYSQPKLKGKKFSDERKRKLSEAHKGYVMPKEQRKKISEALSGGKSHLWRGGITKINMVGRRGVEYKLWRKAVFERDNYTCIFCGIKSTKGVKVYLNADHIKPWAFYPELRFAIDNGRTLCLSCHKKTDTFGSKLYYKKCQ